MKINFSNQTVSISTSMSFASMAALEDLLQTGVMEAVEAGDGLKTTAICLLADDFGIDLDVELIEAPGAGGALGNDPEGSEEKETYLPDIATSQ